MVHMFDVAIAKEYGITEAILFEYIFLWLEKNRADGVNYYNNEYWVYISIKSLAQLFPYLTTDKIRRTVDKMVEKKLIMKDTLSEDTKDRTLWYTLGENGKMLKKSEILHLANLPNQNAKKVRNLAFGNSAKSEYMYIYTNNKDINNNIYNNNIYNNNNNNINNNNININNKENNNINNTNNKENEIDLDFEILWKLYPSYRKQGKKAAKRAYKRVCACSDSKTTFEEVKCGIERYKAFIEKNNIKQQYVMQGSTFFNGERWNDEYDVENKKSNYDDDCFI